MISVPGKGPDSKSHTSQNTVVLKDWREKDRDRKTSSTGRKPTHTQWLKCKDDTAIDNCEKNFLFRQEFDIKLS